MNISVSLTPSLSILLAALMKLRGRHTSGLVI